MNNNALSWVDAQYPPLAILPARLGWTMVTEVAYADPPRLAIGLAPAFPGCNANLEHRREILWDILRLYESARCPGAYWVLNCTCGYGPDAEIELPVFVSHPNPETIVWEIDIAGLRPVLEERWQRERGFLRLIHDRREYEAEIRAMLRTIQAACTDELPVETLDPDVQGCAYEAALEIDSEATWGQEPVLPACTLVEFSIQGADVHAIDGKRTRRWPNWLFPAWSVHAAFERWMGFVYSGSALPYVCEEQGIAADLARLVGPDRQNDYFLLRESDRLACDLAGKAFVRLLAEHYAASSRTVGVTFAYRPCQIPALLP